LRKGIDAFGLKIDLARSILPIIFSFGFFVSGKDTDSSGGTIFVDVVPNEEDTHRKIHEKGCLSDDICREIACQKAPPSTSHSIGPMRHHTPHDNLACAFYRWVD
jgi:hypothetical protein